MALMEPHLRGLRWMHTRWARPLRKAGGLSCTTWCTRSRHLTYSNNRRRKPRKCSAVRMEPGTASAGRLSQLVQEGHVRDRGREGGGLTLKHLIGQHRVGQVCVCLPCCAGLPQPLYQAPVLIPQPLLICLLDPDGDMGWELEWGRCPWPLRHTPHTGSREGT